MGRLGYVPERGHIVKLNFSPTRGHEQKGYRPALVISTKDYNTLTHRAIVCPITSKLYRYPFVVFIHGKVSGSILVDQIRSIDWQARLVKHAGECSAEIMNEVASQLFAIAQGK